MREAGTVMEITQTLGCPMQLFAHFSEGNGENCGATYQFQPVDVILPDEFHDVPVRHPFRNSNELPSGHVPLNPVEFQDVRMGQRIPEYNFFAELLAGWSELCLKWSRMPWTLTFLIFRMSSCFATLMVFTATRHPLYVPVLISANPPEASISSETLISSVIIIDSGNRPWIAASLLNVTKKACFSFPLSVCSAMP